MQQLSMTPALRDGNCEAEDRFVFGFAAALVALQPVGVGCARARALAQELLDVAQDADCLPGELDAGRLSNALRHAGLQSCSPAAVSALLHGPADHAMSDMARSLAS